MISSNIRRRIRLDVRGGCPERPRDRGGVHQLGERRRLARSGRSRACIHGTSKVLPETVRPRCRPWTTTVSPASMYRSGSTRSSAKFCGSFVKNSPAPLTTAVDAAERRCCPGVDHTTSSSISASTAGDVAGGEGRVAGPGQVHVAGRGHIRRLGGGDDAGLWREDLVRRVECHLRQDVQAEGCHGRAEPLLAEGVERCLALPAVEVVTVLPLPPGQVRQPSVRPPVQPARPLPDGVVLLPA